MKKLILTSALALAIASGASAPAHAEGSQNKWIEVESFSWSTYSNTFSCIPYSTMIGLLLSAIQSGRG